MSTTSHRLPLILDACCLINLFASRHIEEIFVTLPHSIRVADYVIESEALWIYGGLSNDVRSCKEKINLRNLEKAGLIIRDTLDSDAEENTAINYAYNLKDDGEAITGAIAVHRNWVMATDDGKAIKFLAKQAPSLKIVTTLELVKTWADNKNPSAEELRSVLWNIRERASYKPHESHLLGEWWKRCI